MADTLEELMTDEFDIPMGIAAAGCASDAEVGAAVVYFTEGPGVDHPKRHHLWRIFARLYRDRALRESHDALEKALREEVGRCPRCYGRGVYSPHCFKCDDSTFDHDDCPPEVPCDRCVAARAALAKAEALHG